MTSENPKEPFVIDLDQNSATLNIPKEIYVRILTKAITQTHQDIDDMKDALPEEDFEKVQAISHRLKGDYDNLHLTALSSIAKEINEITRGSQDKETTGILLNEFEGFFQQLCQFIENLK